MNVHKIKRIVILSALGWSFLYTINMTFTKSLNSQVPTITVLFWRSLFGVLFFTPFLIKRGWKMIKTDCFFLHITRGFLMTISIYLTYTAYRNLPLIMATSVGFTAPLIMTILSIIFLKEEISWRKWIVVCMGYIGMILIVRPSIISLDFYVLFSLGANVFACFSLLIVRKLAQHDSPETVMLYANLCVMIISGFIILCIHQWQPLSWNDLQHIFIIAFWGVSGQYCYAIAVKYAQSSFVAPFEYLRIIFAIPIGLYGFQENLDLIMLLGCLIIIGSTWILERLDGKEIV